LFLLLETDCFICEVQTEAEETTDFINIAGLTREVQTVLATPHLLVYVLSKIN